MSLPKEFPRQPVCCRLPVEISTGDHQTIRSLVPADLNPYMAGVEPVEVQLFGTGVDIDVQTDDAELGVVLPAAGTLTIKGLNCANQLVRSTAAASTIRAIIYFA